MLEHEHGIEIVEAVRGEWSLPAVGFMAFGPAEVGRAVVRGTRRAGGPVAATADDLWHLGSIGKSMTSAALAALVGAGALSWDVEVGRALPELADAPLAPATLRDLLAHRSGIRTDPPVRLLLRYLALGGDAARVSERMLARAAGERPAFEPGSDFLYSNLGYGLAAAIAARTTGIAYLDLLRAHVLGPAELRTATIGVPPQDGTAPFEHRLRRRGGRWVPVAQGRRAVDDLPALAPSGCVSATLADIAAYGAWHLRIARGAQPDAAHVAITHQPVGPPPEPEHGWRYGLGWFVVPARGGPVLLHAGSTGGSFAILALAPDRARGVALVANGFRPEWGHPDDSMARRLLALLA